MSKISRLRIDATWCTFQWQKYPWSAVCLQKKVSWLLRNQLFVYQKSSDLYILKVICFKKISCLFTKYNCRSLFTKCKWLFTKKSGVCLQNMCCLFTVEEVSCLFTKKLIVNKNQQVCLLFKSADCLQKSQLFLYIQSCHLKKVISAKENGQ